MAADGALTSAPVPPPDAEDHQRGPDAAPVVIAYSDFECPYCAQLSVALQAQELRHVFRHFPVRSAHPRAWPAACAAEAAALQGGFWQMHDSLFGDQGRLDDPHLWQRAEDLGLDLERFERDRRSQPVRDRVVIDFRSGVRAGVVSTPAVFRDGVMYSGRPAIAIIRAYGWGARYHRPGSET